MNQLTQEFIKEHLDYDSVTGIFRWIKPLNDNHRNIRLGHSITTNDGRGYIIIQISGIKIKAHRLAWLYIYGQLPEKDIDHIDRCRTNNAIANLRLADRKLNCINSSNCTNATGIYWYKSRNKWKAQISINGKKINLGYFEDKNDALQAYKIASEERKKSYENIDRQTEYN